MKSEDEQIKKELEELKAKYNQLIGEVRYITDRHEKFERKLFYVSAILFVVVIYVYFPFFKNLWLSVDPFMRGVLAVLLVISFPIWIWFIFNI
jgi:predicted RND superfamily exporter protein